MINGKLTSIGTILWRILRQPIASDLSYEQCAEFALEYIKLIGAPLSFESKISDPIDFDNYKILSPVNMISLRGVKVDGVALKYGSSIYTNEEDGCNSDYTYTLQNCVITTSVKKGCAIISYKAISTDEYGYPLVPDNESFRMGLEYYVMHRFLEPLWTMGKITDKVFQYYEQKRHFYSGQASNAMMIQNFDHLETMMLSLNRMIVDVHPQETFYKNFARKETIKKYN